MNAAKFRTLVAGVAARGGIILFFVMALEAMIMISPFAFFFYSVFNPVFNWLDQYGATRWLGSSYPSVFVHVNVTCPESARVNTEPL